MISFLFLFPFATKADLDLGSDIEDISDPEMSEIRDPPGILLPAGVQGKSSLDPATKPENVTSQNPLKPSVIQVISTNFEILLKTHKLLSTY